MNFLQNIQDCFALSLNMTLISIRNGEYLTKPSNATDFCDKYIRKDKSCIKLCYECHNYWEKEAIKIGSVLNYECHAGLTNFIVPVILDGKYFASVLCGQFLTEKLSKNNVKNISKKLKLEEGEFFKKISSVRIISDKSSNSAKYLLYIMLNSIVANIYADFQLSKSELNYRIPKNPILDELFFKNYAFQELILKKYNKVQRTLTSREYEILKLVALGKSNNEIAKELFISMHTVKAHVSSILEKFEVKDRVQLSVKAARENLI